MRTNERGISFRSLVVEKSLHFSLVHNFRQLMCRQYAGHDKQLPLDGSIRLIKMCILCFICSAGHPSNYGVLSLSLDRTMNNAHRKLVCNVVASQAKDFSMSRIHLTRNFFIIYAKTVKRIEMLSDNFSSFLYTEGNSVFNAIEKSSIFRTNKIQNMRVPKSFDAFHSQGFLGWRLFCI